MLMIFGLSQLALAANQSLAADDVIPKMPEVSLTPHDAKNAMVLLELENKGKHSHTLIAAYSPVAKQVQLHKSDKIKRTSHPEAG